MDVDVILEQLREECSQIERAIIFLERMQLGNGKRRGRPPKWMQEAKFQPPTRSKRRGRPKNNRSAMQPETTFVPAHLELP
jgi:hypothetical protein